MVNLSGSDLPASICRVIVGIVTDTSGVLLRRLNINLNPLLTSTISTSTGLSEVQI
jgi:hypothetical protein